jgi:hypothetical protein
MTSWWVNQGTTYAEELEAGQLWAPIVAHGGQHFV